MRDECASSNKEQLTGGIGKKVFFFQKAVEGAKGRQELVLAQGKEVNCFRVAGAIYREQD